MKVFSDFKYPTGTPQITSEIVVLPVGEQTGEHIHTHPAFGFIIDGEVTVDYGDHGVKKYQKGESLIEPVNIKHNGTNTGDKPTKILVVVLGEK